MKQLLLGAFIAGAMVSSTQAQPGAVGEIAYPKGSVGYEAQRCSA